MKQPRSLELRKDDAPETVYQRITEWARDVAALLGAAPSVTYTTVNVPASGLVSVAVTGRVRCVMVARVESGTLTGAAGVHWSPTRNGFDVEALYGVSGAARVTLRVEV